MKRAKSDPESVGNALSKAAERAKAINSKLGSGKKQFFKSNLENKYFSPKTSFKNVAHCYLFKPN